MPTRRCNPNYTKLGKDNMSKRKKYIDKFTGDPMDACYYWEPCGTCGESFRQSEGVEPGNTCQECVDKSIKNYKPKEPKIVPHKNDLNQPPKPDHVEGWM